MVRETSIQQYHAIQESGLITGLKWEVYHWLFNNGPATQMEVCCGIDSNIYHQVRSYTPRFSELERMDIIQTVGTRKCKVTGNDSIEWDVTVRQPRKLPQIPAQYVYVCDACSMSWDRIPRVHATSMGICTGELSKWRKVK